jgi:hypothetical protein
MFEPPDADDDRGPPPAPGQRRRYSDDRYGGRTPMGGGMGWPTIRLVAWAVCVLWTGGACLFYLGSMSKAQSAIQEASLAANACFWVIVAYVIARAVDSVSR